MANIDVNLITENFVEILTNTISVSSVLSDIFFSPDPASTTLQQYVYNEGTGKIEVVETKVDNIAKIKEELAG